MFIHKGNILKYCENQEQFLPFITYQEKYFTSDDMSFSHFTSSADNSILDKYKLFGAFLWFIYRASMACGNKQNSNLCFHEMKIMSLRTRCLPNHHNSSVT